MKKLLTALFLILILAFGVYVLNYYSGGYIIDVVEDIAINATASTRESTTVKIDSSKYETSPISFYNKLSDKEKKAYDSIYQGLINHKKTILVSKSLENETVSDIISMVLCEHPEIFYVSDSYTVDSFGRLEFDYRYDEKQSEELYTKIEEKSKRILSAVTEDMDDYEKSLYVYDYLAESVYYDNNALSDLSADRDVSTIVGPLLQGRAVCGGYAASYQYLLKLLGIEALFVYGTAETPADSGNHAWVVQQLNGDYYFTDPTWGDSFDGDKNDELPNHTYFCITTKELEKTHTIDKIFNFPEFTAQEDNYFVRQGCLLDEYSKSTVKKIIRESLSSGEYNIEIKFATEAAYDDSIDRLVEKGNIYYILKEIDPFSKTIDTNNLSYSNDDDHYVLTLMLKSA